MPERCCNYCIKDGESRWRGAEEFLHVKSRILDTRRVVELSDIMVASTAGLTWSSC